MLGSKSRHLLWRNLGRHNRQAVVSGVDTELLLAPSSSSWNSNNQQEEDARQCRLLSAALPVVQVQRQQQRYASTTSTPSSTTTPSLSTTTTTTPVDDDHRTRRERIRDRADAMRDSAREQWDDFRAHPGESARHGAFTAGAMIKKYGPLFIGTYFTVYFSTLGVFFIGVESGVLDPVQLFHWLGASSTESTSTAGSTVDVVVDFMKNHSFTERFAHYVEKNPSVANLAVAWIAVKFTEPIRFAFTLAITPRLARYLGYTTTSVTEEVAAAAEATATAVHNDSNTAQHESTAAPDQRPIGSPMELTRDATRSMTETKKADGNQSP